MKMKKRTGRIQYMDFLIVDILGQQLAFLISGFLFCKDISPYQSRAYLVLALVYVFMDVATVFAFGTLDNTLKRGYYKEFTAALKHVLLVNGLVFVYLFEAQKNFLYSRAFIYSMFPLYLFFTYVGRIFWKKQLKQMGAWGLGGALLIVAPRDRIQECVQNVCRTDYNVYSSVGAVIMDADCAGSVIEKIPVVANYSQLLDYIRTEWVDEVLIVTSLGKDYPKELVEQLKGIKIAVHVTITEAGSISENLQRIERMGNYMVLTTGSTRATSRTVESETADGYPGRPGRLSDHGRSVCPVCSSHLYLLSGTHFFRAGTDREKREKI